MFLEEINLFPLNKTLVVEWSTRGNRSNLRVITPGPLCYFIGYSTYLFPYLVTSRFLQYQFLHPILNIDKQGITETCRSDLVLLTKLVT